MLFLYAWCRIQMGLCCIERHITKLAALTFQLTFRLPTLSSILSICLSVRGVYAQRFVCMFLSLSPIHRLPHLINRSFIRPSELVFVFCDSFVVSYQTMMCTVHRNAKF